MTAQEHEPHGADHHGMSLKHASDRCMHGASSAAKVFALTLAITLTTHADAALDAPQGGVESAMVTQPLAPQVDASAPAHAETDATSLIALLFVFMLATCIGLGVIRRVSRLLHTPLMSLTNAISAIAVVGAILVAGGVGDGDAPYPPWVRVLGACALFASMVNIVSGFLITNRMLKMFKPEAKQAAAPASSAQQAPRGASGGGA